MRCRRELVGKIGRALLCPEGAAQDSPGQRPGLSVLSVIYALKGHNNIWVKGLFRPFRAWLLVRCHTQGDALGFLVLAFQAKEQNAGYGQLRISDPKGSCR